MATMASARFRDCNDNVSLNTTYWNLPNSDVENGYPITKTTHNRKLPSAGSGYRHVASTKMRHWKLIRCGYSRQRSITNGGFAMENYARAVGILLPMLCNCAES